MCERATATKENDDEHARARSEETGYYYLKRSTITTHGVTNNITLQGV
jgi:hypothetical protein